MNKMEKISSMPSASLEFSVEGQLHEPLYYSALNFVIRFTLSMPFQGANKSKSQCFLGRDKNLPNHIVVL